MLDISHLGDRIRAVRKSRLMTIKTLSQFTGMSVGYLSTLEQNKTTPTIDNLAKICEVLNVSITDILEYDKPGHRVIRKKDIKENKYPDENMVVGIIDFKHDNCVLEHIRIGPGEATKRQECRHVANEMCTVITGVLTIDVEGEVYELYPGDSVFIKGGERHSIFNQGIEETLSVWIYQRNTGNIL